MSCIIIYDTDSEHNRKLKLMLQNDGAAHDFRYVEDTRQVMNIIDAEKADIFLCCIDDESTLTQEMLELFPVISPDTVILFLSECRSIPYVLDTMNRNNPFRLIIKPCQCAEDILEPICDAYKQLELSTLEPSWKKEMPVNEQLAEQLQKVKLVMRQNKQFYECVSYCVGGILKENMQLMGKEDDTVLNNFVYHIFESYLSYKIFGEESFQEYCTHLTSIWNREQEQCTFTILQGKNVQISREEAPKIAFIIFLLGGFVQEVLLTYHLQIAITQKDGYYIIRQNLDEEQSTNMVGELRYQKNRQRYLRPFSTIVGEILDYISVKNVIDTAQNPFDITVLVKQIR